MRRHFWIGWSAVLSVLSPLTAGYSASPEGGLVVEDTDEPSTVTYQLIARNGNSVQPIWKKEVPKINGQPVGEWARLISWDRQGNALIALLEINEFIVSVVQADGLNKPADSKEFGKADWLRHSRNGGILRVEAPNKIILEQADGKPLRSFFFSKGRLTPADGGAPEEDSVIVFDGKGGWKKVPESSVPVGSTPANAASSATPGATNAAP